MTVPTRRTATQLCLTIAMYAFGSANALSAQSSTMDEIRLFQNTFRDAPITDIPYGEALFNVSNRDNSGLTSIGVQGGLGLQHKIELNGGVYFSSLNPDGDASGESGLLDIPVYGRYNFVAEEQMKVSGGTYLTLPVGSDDLGQGHFNFGFFGAIRHAIKDSPVTVTGNLGVDFVEQPGFIAGPICIPTFNPVTGYFEILSPTCVPGPASEGDRIASVGIGGGAVYAANDLLHLLGEIRIEPEFDYAALSGGADYRASSHGRLRGNLLVGIDEGAPNVGLTLAFLTTFGGDGPEGVTAR